ncbi:hypothetical protein [Cytobacillus purgationiresistens]|uniref:Uncharacterized protein n=1 Tax=Cytobacillus purgationiresistens TaxID=863449 RepID=A0ABU0AJ08_9BACI|nr:hypothetical protein [Cytobacillus purgationiresistens]MDQ0271241.1 hypothetical protein [Cytobacillus purgationiresistens]
MNEIEISSEQFPLFFSVVKNKGIWFKNIEIEYRPNKKMLLIRFEGTKSMKLTTKYLDQIKEQLLITHEKIIKPLISNYKQNFITQISVNRYGVFSFTDFTIKLNVKCNDGIGVLDTFKTPLKVLLPFSLYITNIIANGIRNKMSYIDAFISISLDELTEIITDPIVAPRAKKQWLETSHMMYSAAKEEYQYRINIPCIDGELYWDNTVETIQLTFNNSEMRMLLDL